MKLRWLALAGRHDCSGRQRWIRMPTESAGGRIVFSPTTKWKGATPAAVAIARRPFMSQASSAFRPQARRSLRLYAAGQVSFRKIVEEQSASRWC